MEDRKRAYYCAQGVVATYEARRFAGRSGRYIHEREVGTILEMLPPCGRILDLPAGTGRISEALKQRGFEVVLGDYSPAMLEACGRRGLNPRVRMDAVAPCFQPRSFDAIVCAHFACHVPDVEQLLCLLQPLLRRGGRLVMDCVNWSVLSFVPVLKWRFGGPVYIHHTARVEAAAHRAGLAILAKRSSFFLSQWMYRYLPFPIVRLLDQLEGHAPAGWLVKSYYCMEPRG
jgi:2-polyprenyl-3-methyl-5-hydroxy-6-metoxy-1,4-benzoquinol methylase